MPPSLFLPDGVLQGDAPVPRVSLWTDSCWAAPPLDTAPAGKPQAREGEQGQQVSMGWAWSVPGLAESPQELRAISGDWHSPAQSGLWQEAGSAGWASILGSAPWGTREFYSWQMGLERQSGLRGTGSLGRPWQALVFSPEPTLDAVGGCVCGWGGGGGG